jgi:hypothetical protein
MPLWRSVISRFLIGLGIGIGLSAAHARSGIDLHAAMLRLLIPIKRLALLVPLLSGLAASPALAGSVTGTVTITIQAPLKVVFSPLVPTVLCTAAAGTVVATLSTTGGDGSAASFTASGGDTADFAVSGANVVVGPNGIAAASCGATENLTVAATQP